MEEKMTRSRRLAVSFGSLAILAAVAIAAVSPAPAADLVPAMTCEELSGVSWGGFVLDEVSEVEAGANDPAHCRVLGTIDEEIHFELLLPTAADWNGRFLMGGGGGYVGSVQNQALGFAGPVSVLSRGFATAGTDTGHEGSGIDASWALNRPDREVNFGHRAGHVTAEAAKTIIRLYYGRDIEYSYFVGCSRGGGQGMMSSQRYPDDFDGIVSGAPAYDWTGLGAFFLQTQQALYPDPAELSTPVIDAAAAAILETAILEACDGNDGVRDGFMTNPLECDIDISSIPGLSAEQRRAAEVIYGGAQVGDRRVYPGFPFGVRATPPAGSCGSRRARSRSARASRTSTTRSVRTCTSTSSSTIRSSTIPRSISATTSRGRNRPGAPRRCSTRRIPTSARSRRRAAS